MCLTFSLPKATCKQVQQTFAAFFSAQNHLLAAEKSVDLQVKD